MSDGLSSYSLGCCVYLCVYLNAFPFTVYLEWISKTASATSNESAFENGCVRFSLFFCAIYHSLNLLLAHIIDMLGFCITLHDDRHNTKHEHRAYYLLFIAVYSIPFYSWRRNCLFLQFSFGSFWASVGWFFFLLRFDDYYFVLDCHSECKHSSQFQARYVRKSECVCAVLSPYFHLQYDGICHRNWTKLNDSH